uniref:Uncharacterized protein n=1 Tax=Setaria italica TaxID=4555 RepID=K3YDH2_SETIT
MDGPLQPTPPHLASLPIQTPPWPAEGRALHEAAAEMFKNPAFGIYLIGEAAYNRVHPTTTTRRPVGIRGSKRLRLSSAAVRWPPSVRPPPASLRPPPAGRRLPPVGLRPPVITPVGLRQSGYEFILIDCSPRLPSSPKLEPAIMLFSVQ